MNSNYRVAEMLIRLMNGETISYDQLKSKYQVSLRTFQRDLHDIKAVLLEHSASFNQLVEAGSGQQYRLDRVSDLASLEMVLTISNVLLGSRALVPAELTKVLGYLQAKLTPEMQQRASDYLKIAKPSYTPITDAAPIMSRLRLLADCIITHQRLTFTYKPASIPASLHRYQAQPIAMFFERFYFYVAMVSADYSGYRLYRVDRIGEIQTITPGAKISAAQHFSLLDHRHQTYLLDSGNSLTFRVECRDCYPNTVLDNFPMSHIVKKSAAGYTVVEVHAKLDGALIWLLGQGARVKVLSPPSLIAQLKAAHQAAVDLYE